MFDIASTALPQVKAGALKGLAVTSAQRSPDAPNLPTMVSPVGVHDLDRHTGLSQTSKIKRLLDKRK